MRRIAAIALVTPLFAVPAVTPAHAAATKKLTIKTQKQQKYYWCSPAAGRAILSRLITRGLPSQAKLAGWMGTKPPDGTSREGLRNGLRKALRTYAPRPHEVIPLSPRSQSSFLTNVQTAVGRKKVALIYRVYAGYKPWGSQRNDKTGHSMVVYGYTTGSNPKILWWDPADNSRHTASLSKSWASVKKAGHHGQVAFPV
ncbi:C39 family peptidase [Actinomadura kijaniata]|uniref:C39 family peptidase n=1 Tax=Actinomadura kijaniata TaxID=46161 RepID=UPI003F1A5BA8